MSGRALVLLGDLELVTAPTAEPFTLAEARAHVRETYPDDAQGVVLMDAVTTARIHVESQTGWRLVPCRLAYVARRLPSAAAPLVFPVAPVRAVVSVEAVTEPGGDLEELAPAMWTWRQGAYPQAIQPARGHTWPEADVYASAPVRVTIDAGFADVDTLKAQAAPLRQAVALLTDHFYRTRGEQIIGAPMSPAAIRAQDLMAPWRLPLVAAA